MEIQLPLMFLFSWLMFQTPVIWKLTVITVTHHSYHLNPQLRGLELRLKEITVLLDHRLTTGSEEEAVLLQLATIGSSALWWGALKPHPLATDTSKTLLA